MTPLASAVCNGKLDASDVRVKKGANIQAGLKVRAHSKPWPHRHDCTQADKSPP
jgi:hypothetical protein